MKTAIKTVLTRKVHYLLFASTCLLLIGMALSAKMMADDISAMSDGFLEVAAWPILAKAQI